MQCLREEAGVFWFAIQRDPVTVGTWTPEAFARERRYVLLTMRRAG